MTGDSRSADEGAATTAALGSVCLLAGFAELETTGVAVGAGGLGLACAEPNWSIKQTHHHLASNHSAKYH